MSYSFLKYLVSVVSCVLIVACQPPPEPEKPKGILRIATVPTDMPITVDGRLKGNSPSGDGQFFSISLEEGNHTISIFKSIDDEKDQYFEKNVYVAADTVQVITLEAKERLTAFGTEEKIRRENEAAMKVAAAKELQKKRDAIGKINWAKTYEDGSFSTVEGLAIDEKKNIWIANDNDSTILKLDQFGKKVFLKRYPLKGTTINDIKTLGNNDIVAAGHVFSNRDNNAYLFKISADGALLWERSIGERRNEEILIALATTSDGMVVAAGYSDGGENGLLIRLDGNGDIVWKKTIPGYDFFSIVEADDGGIIAGGRYINNVSAAVKISALGDIVWKKTFRETKNSGAITDMAKIDGVGFFLGSNLGINFGEDERGDKALIRKIDEEGNILWAKSYGHSKRSYFRSVLSLPDGGALIGSDFVPNATPVVWQENIGVMRLSKDGKALWTRSFGGNKIERLKDMALSPPSSLVMGGYKVKDSYVVKMENVLSKGINQ